MNREQLQERTEEMAVRKSKVADALPKTLTGRAWGNQLLRAGASVGANYREAAHASSKRHFISVLEIAQREGNEAIYWLRIIGKAGLIRSRRLEPLTADCNEIAAILAASMKTAKNRI